MASVCFEIGLTIKSWLALNSESRLSLPLNTRMKAVYHQAQNAYGF